MPPAFRLVAFARLDSTNLEARRRADAGAEDGTLIWALEQTDGKGRSGRNWVSTPGNLFMSLLIRPGTDARTAALASFAASLALHDTLKEIHPDLDVSCKWPNDLLVDGRKVAGILLESSAGASGALDRLIIGIGVNLAQAPEGTEFPAGLVPGAIEPADFLEKLAAHLNACLSSLWAHGFEDIRQRWLLAAAGIGKPIRVRLPDQTLHGTFDTLTENGALVLRTPAGVQEIHAGDVFFGSS